jgi:regulator of sigma E protease
MNSILAFVIVLGVLIFFHEFGHFIVARLFGVGVEKFSLGFGPRIIGRKVGITDYRISAIPLGGYVKMVGEEPDAELEPEQIPISFTHKPVWKRILIVAAGPFFNVLLAAVIFFALFVFVGSYVLQPTVGKVGEATPAEKAGIRAGDRIVAIDGQRVESWDDMAGIISSSNGGVLHITVQREQERFEADVTPRLTETKNLFGEAIQRYVIGITASGDVVVQELGFFEALGQSVVQTWRVTELTVVSIVKIFQGTVSTKTLGGPIMIAQLAGEQAREGMTNLAFFTALISINLAILNILPIPVLDGGHLLFFMIEAVIGRPVNIRVREIAQQAGIFLLLLLMVYVFYNDISRIFFSQPG